MKKAAVFFADGFEEVEALTPVDMLRRAGVEVTMVAMLGKTAVTGSHGITVKADILFEDADFDDTDLFVLPGGMPGTTHLKESEPLLELLVKAAGDGKLVSAICAAPTVLGKAGLLKGRTATCYPGCEDGLTGAVLSTESVVVDGNIVTSRGAGTAMPFSFKLIELLLGAGKSADMKKKVVYGHCKA